MMTDDSTQLPERFRTKFRVTDTGCWEWVGRKNGDGYGQFDVGSRTDGTRKSVAAHRWVWEILRGEVPAGTELDHLCRVRGCVNPSHLEAVTHAENVRRGEGGSNMSNKTHCAQGHPFDDANTRIARSNGKPAQRRCRVCEARWDREYKERNRILLAEKRRARKRQRKSAA
jgi:hypothetical protein